MIILPLVAMSVSACSPLWPDDNMGEQSSPPSNLVVWAEDQGDGNDLAMRDSSRGNHNEVMFTAVNVQKITMGSQVLRAYAAPNNAQDKCFFDVATNRSHVCVGDTIDDEAPIDPTIRARLTLPTYGSPSDGIFSSREARPIFRCAGGGDDSGNLILNLESDEGGSLLALVTVKVAGETVREEALRVNGPTEGRFDIGATDKATVEVRFIDQAGNFGETATVEVDAPEGGCSHSGIGLWLLAGLVGLRRRLA